MDKQNSKKIFSITNERFYNFVRTAIAIVLGLVLAFITLCLLSNDPVNAIVTILTGSLRKARYIGVIIEKFTPFLFGALAACLLFKCGFFNLGGEGVVVMCGLFVSFVACNETLSSLGSFLHPIVCILVSCLVGGLLMLIPAFFKAKFNANEMVMSLMLNSAYSGLATYIIKYHFLSNDNSLIASPNFQATSKINYLPFEFCNTYHISIMFPIGILIAVFVWYLLNKTKLGYQIRLVGENPRFADYSGINSFKLSMKVNFLAGLLYGLAAATYLLTQADYFQWTGGSTSSIGWTGIMLTMLGQNNPIGVFVSTFLIKYLEQGTTVLYYTDTTVPSEIVVIIEGAIILLVSSKYFLRGLREKKLLKEGLQSEYRSDREGK